MRIAIVHSFYRSDQPSGENVVVQAQTSALRDSGHEVGLVSLSSDFEKRSGMKDARTAARVSTRWGRSPTREIRAFAPDVIHIHNLFPNWSESWVRNIGVPVVATLHNYRRICAAGTLFRDGAPCTECIDHTSARSLAHACYRDSRLATLPLAIANWRSPTETPLFRAASRLITLNHRAQRTFESVGVPTSKLVTVPNFAPDPGASTTTDRRERWVYAGRLTEEKGVRAMVEAWPTSVGLDIFGSGPLHKSLSNQIESRPNIRLLGPVPHDQLMVSLRSSAGVVVPSLWTEGIPTIFIEALALGTPVISAPGNSISDALQEFELGGNVFTSFNELADTIEATSKDWEHISKVSRQLYDKRFSEPIWLRRIESVYDHAVATP